MFLILGTDLRPEELAGWLADAQLTLCSLICLNRKVAVRRSIHIGVSPRPFVDRQLSISIKYVRIPRL